MKTGMQSRLGHSVWRCKSAPWVAALAAGLSVMPAQAVETFSIPYGGTATIPIDCFIQPSGCGLVTFSWQSTVTLKTVSATDGIYRFDSFPMNNPSNTLLFLSLVSDRSATPLFGNLDLSTLNSGLLGGVSATLQGGRVVGLDGALVGDFQATWSFAGDALSFDLHLAPNSGPYSGHATMIPEPSSLALMLGGLGAGWIARRRRKAGPAQRR